jgi:hypothetical protein
MCMNIVYIARRFATMGRLPVIQIERVLKMLRKSAVLLLFIMLSMLLNGCMVVTQSREVQSGPMVVEEIIAATQEMEERVVTMVPAATRTPTPEGAVEPAVRGAPPTAATLAELGLQAANYTDPYARLVLDYPAAWRVTAPVSPELSTGYSTTFTDPSSPPDRLNKVDLTVVQDRPYTIESAVADRKSAMASDDFPPTILVEEEWQLAGGLNGTYIVAEGRGERFSQLITAVDGRMILLTGLGDPDLIRAIAATLRTE